MAVIREVRQYSNNAWGDPHVFGADSDNILIDNTHASVQEEDKNSIEDHDTLTTACNKFNALRSGVSAFDGKSVSNSVVSNDPLDPTDTTETNTIYSASAINNMLGSQMIHLTGTFATAATTATRKYIDTNATPSAETDIQIANINKLTANHKVISCTLDHYDRQTSTWTITIDVDQTTNDPYITIEGTASGDIVFDLWIGL